MTRRTTTLLAAAVALAATTALTGCSADPEPQLKATGAYIPKPVMPDMAGGFMVIENTGEAADKLVKVTSPVSDDVQIHETVDNKMKQVKSFDIPAKGKLELKRRGSHIMFMNLKEKLAEGGKVSVELHFEKADPIKLDVPVMATNYDPQK
ncbi:copper chaperone PCu(A)C [Streptomyces sp. URMC 123]|uniref:copper chaperone PCu(A)C n=1 Tax=Streptomyces sp. URMC 123 TaxID=3423403 RepID=UPI003F1C6065